jgi:transketolase
LGWGYPPFELPDDIVTEWRAIGAKGAAANQSWTARLTDSGKSADLFAAPALDIAGNPAWQAYKAALASDKPKMATRKASEKALGVLTEQFVSLLGGSADLTGSNNTKTSSTKPLSKDDYSGRYIYYGIREFGMAAAMNGMALHGGVVPFGGTFLVFSDYCRPAIRLSALQEARVVYVMTHDSIGLGEDGPTHQPIEHLQSLRAMPGLDVFRPADVLETAECWELALEKADGPALLALTRQDLPALRDDASDNMCARGGYRLRGATAARKVVLIATGSEVPLAVDIAAALESHGIGTDVVSMPCTQLFDRQDADYRAAILGTPDLLRVTIEAGTTFGWERYAGLDGLRLGIDSFGASAPIADLYDHFGLTTDKIVPQILQKLS